MRNTFIVVFISIFITMCIGAYALIPSGSEANIKSESAASGSQINTQQETIGLGEFYDLDKLSEQTNIKKGGLIGELKQKAYVRIFKHAFESAEWFAEEHYSMRNDESAMKEKMETYLIKQQSLDDFLIIATAVIDKELKKIACEFFNDSNINVKHKIDIRNILKKSLPGAKEMVEEIYKHLEKTGANSKYRSYLINVYGDFRSKYPDSTITAEAFIGIGTVLLANIYLPGIGTLLVAGAVSSAMAALEFKHAQDVKNYKTELVTGIKKTQADFDLCLEKTANVIAAAFIDKLKTAKIIIKRKL